MEKFISKSYEETIKIAKNFAKSLESGDVVLLCGDLGVGKTVFSKGVISWLTDGKENATSPTFVIMNEYYGKLKVYHFDLYRIDDPSELETLGFEEYLFSDAVCLVEWPERAGEFLPEKCIRVEISWVAENVREIKIDRQVKDA